MGLCLIPGIDLKPPYPFEIATRLFLSGHTVPQFIFRWERRYMGGDR